MSQPQLPVAPDDPHDHNSWMQYVEALNPGKVTLTDDATDEQRREWNRKVRVYRLNPMVRRHAATMTRPAPVIACPTRTDRPRERRDRSGRSSARSGDSGSDSDGSEPEPPLGWRWIQPESWRLADQHRHARSNRGVASAVPA
jgi:hypothetical protein